MNKLEVRTVFIDHKQNNQLGQLVTAEFVVNNKTYLVTKISIFSFIVNYSRELQIEVNIRKKEKVEKVMNVS